MVGNENSGRRADPIKVMQQQRQEQMQKIADMQNDSAYLPNLSGVRAVALKTSSALVSSQWTDSSSNIYFNAGNVGIGTTAPTHALTFPVSSTGISIYNTSDQTTNLERGLFFWSSNVLRIDALRSGTGTARNIRIGTQSRGFLIDEAGTSGAFYNFVNSTGSTSTILALTTTRTNSSGTNVEFTINPTINQSSTAGYIALHINPTETATGSGTKRLISAQVGSVDKFVVTNTGNATVSGNIDFATVSVSTVAGVSGYFVSSDLQGVTVTNGIITSIEVL